MAVLCSAADGSPAGSQQTMSSRVLLATVAQGNHALVDLGPDDFVIEEGGTHLGVATDLFRPLGLPRCVARVRRVCLR